MSFFDKLGKTISDTTHSVVEKTKSSTDTIRLNGLISDEERLINAAYLNMGKKYAELHSGDAEPEFQEFRQPGKDQRLSGTDPEEQAPAGLPVLRRRDPGDSAVLYQVRRRKSGGQAPGGRACYKRGGRACAA